MIKISLLKLSFWLFVAGLIIVYAQVWAGSPPPVDAAQNEISLTNDDANNAYLDRMKTEEKAADNPFGILLYKPSYILPAYYSFTPDQRVYTGTTPDNQTIKNTEVAAQLSFKVPVWHNIFSSSTDLDVAYTQLSFWQLYQKSAFFRETDYEPEMFASRQMNHWLNLRLGVDHQSNGRGGLEERSWNRAYGDGIVSAGNWMVDVKPWVPIFTADSSALYNPDITHYMGYESTVIAYKFHENVFAVMARNEVETGFRRGAVDVTWSVPLTTHFKVYAEFFSGYGQSLIEYNHYTNAVGLGIALNDWI